MSTNWIIAFLLGFISNFFGWFAINNQIISWWKFNHFASTMILSTISSIILYFAIKISQEDSSWALRWMFFVSSIIMGHILAYAIRSEEFFTLKNICCLLLSCAIVIVQMKL